MPALDRVLPCVCLILVACVQIALARAQALSPWLGGGFGMFASTDHGSARRLLAYRLYDGLREPLELAGTAPRELEKLQSFPTPGRLERFAQRLARLPEGVHGTPRAVRIEIWRIAYARDTLQPALELVRAHELALRDD